MASDLNSPPALPQAFERSSFVGRRHETGELHSSLRKALRGHGQLLLLAGEPGIGKTRLAEEITGVAISEGARTAWGRSWESGGAPAFWLWIQVLRNFVGEFDFKPLTSEQGATPYVAKLISDSCQQRLPSSAGPHAGLPTFSGPGSEGADSHRFHLFDSVGNFFKRASLGSPLAIVLDDLHAADLDSLLLLRFLARDLRQNRILLIGTYREVEARLSPQHAELLSQIAREGCVIPLRGLSENDVAEFIERNAGLPPDHSLVSALYRATEGNPFFLDEIVRLMRAERRPGQWGARLEFTIPDGVRAAIRCQLAPLSKQAKSVLDVAAVIGRTIELPVLQQVSGLPLDQLLDSLGQACRLGLMAEEPGTAKGCTFSHSMIPETIRDELPQASLIRLHQRIAEVLEQLYGSRSEPHLAELAHHYLLALPLGDSGKAIACAMRGAEHALKQLAYEEAARLYKIALKAMETAPESDLAQRCELLLALGEAQSKGGGLEEAGGNFLQAAEMARRVGRADLLGRAALGPAVEARVAGTADTGRIALLEEALEAGGRDETTLRALLLARLADHLHWSHRHHMAESLSQQALEVARRVDDKAALASALWTRHFALWSPDNLDERLAAANEILRLSERAGNIAWTLRGRDLEIVALLELGEIQAVDCEIARYSSLGQEAGLSLSRPKTLRAMRAMMKGELEEAERLAREALATAQRRQDPGALMSFEAQLSQLRTEQGRLDELEATLKDRVIQFPALVVMRCGLAACHAYLGQREQARAEFDYLAADGFNRIPRDWNYLAGIAMASFVCAFLGDASRAVRLYELLRPYALRNITVGWGEACYGSVSHYLGLLARTLCRFDEAQAHFEAALSFNRTLAALALVGHTQCDYAEMLLQRNLRDDRTKAVELAQSALAAADAAGMKGLSVQATELLARLEGSPDRLANGVLRGASPDVNTFRKEGEYWTIAYEGRVFRLKDIKGLSYIAHLLRHPDREFHALTLVGGGETPVDQDSRTRAQASDMRLGPELGDAGEMLDAVAKASYERRLEELREELDEAKELGNEERVSAAEEEIDAVLQELRRAVGLHGRDRRAGSTSERARLSVTRAIKAAVERISEQDATLGRLLDTTIRTGTFCSYAPVARFPVTWKL